MPPPRGSASAVMPVIERFGFEDGEEKERRMTMKNVRGGSSGGLVVDHEVDAGLPWPEPFPMYVGRAFLSNSGVVDDIREVRYLDFEFYPKQDELPEDSQGLARIKMHVFFLVPDKDAPGGTVPNKYKEPNPLSFTRYVIVSKKFKTFQTRGFNLESHYAKMERMKTVTIDDDWVYCQCPLTSGLSVETMLNADNTVLRECNFNLAEVRRTGDWTKGALYAIRAPDEADQNRPGTKIRPPPVDRTNDQMELFKTIFTAPEEAFWNPTSKDMRDVECTFRFKSLSSVVTLSEYLSATVEVELRFPVSKTDIVEWVAAPDQTKWEPLWTPPQFKVSNVAHNAGGVELHYGSYQLVNVNDKYFAKVTIDVRGDFYEQFELQHYPFDVQPLTIELRADDGRVQDCNISTSVVTLDDNGDSLDIRDTEWKFLGAHCGASFISSSRSMKLASSGAAPKGRFCIIGQVCAQRYYAVHIFRVIMVMALFSLTSLAALIPDAEVSSMDRMSLTVTLMLTTAAYSIVLSSELPKLGYLTFLDQYILFTFFFIAFISAEVITIDWAEAEHGLITEKNELLNLLTYANVALWLLSHIGLYFFIKKSVIPGELTKAKSIQSAICGSSASHRASGAMKR